MRYRILLWIVVVVAVLQFYRPEINESSTVPTKDDFLARFDAPADVRRIFAVACYDCHSNTTRYPWYAQVQPVGAWLHSHIEEGKDHLNLSEFGRYSAKKQGHRIDAMHDEIGDRTMPLKSYTWIHTDARLTDAQIKLLNDWLDSIRDQLPSSQ